MKRQIQSPPQRREGRKVSQSLALVSLVGLKRRTEKNSLPVKDFPSLSFAPLRLCVEVFRVSAFGLLMALAPLSHAAPLPEVVSQALAKHPDVRSAQALSQAADAVVRQARSEFFPTVSLEATESQTHERLSGSAGYINDRSRRGDAVIRWSLFNGYADYHSHRSAEFGLDAASLDLEEAREAAALRLSEIYIELLRLNEQMTYAQAYVAELKALVHDVDLRASAGRIPRVEADQAKSRLIRAENEMSQQRVQLAAAGNAFRQLTGRAPVDLSEPVLATALADGSLEELLLKSEEQSPRLRAARTRIFAKDADLQASRADFFPKLNVEARKRVSPAPDTANNTDVANGNTLQLSISVPLGGKSLARGDELLAKKYAALADADSRLLDIKTALGEQQASLREARHMAPLLQDQIATAGRVVVAYRLLFDAGRRSLLDLLTVREDLYQALSLENANRHGQIITTARLAKQLGQLRSTLGLATAE